ncbi:MAG: hypothetical protein ACRCVX_12570 [Shewanella sp.]
MMKSYGVIVPEGVLQAGLDAMTGQFTAAHVEAAILQADCPAGAIASRVTDKLLQRERRAGRIEFSKGFWTKRDKINEQ